MSIFCNNVTFNLNVLWYYYYNINQMITLTRTTWSGAFCKYKRLFKWSTIYSRQIMLNIFKVNANSCLLGFALHYFKKIMVINQILLSIRYCYQSDIVINQILKSIGVCFQYLLVSSDYIKHRLLLHELFPLQRAHLAFLLDGVHGKFTQKQKENSPMSSQTSYKCCL